MLLTCTWTAVENPAKSGQKSGRSRTWPDLSKKTGCRTCWSWGWIWYIPNNFAFSSICYI